MRMHARFAIAIEIEMAKLKDRERSQIYIVKSKNKKQTLHWIVMIDMLFMSCTIAK